MRQLSRPLSGLLLLVALAVAPGCATMGVRSAVDMRVQIQDGTPGAALVYIDDQYIGTLEAVAARGVRVPEGEHRLSVEKTGYFPYDKVIVSAVKPIELNIELLKLPE